MGVVGGDGKEYIDSSKSEPHIHPMTWFSNHNNKCANTTKCCLEINLPDYMGVGLPQRG